MGLDWGGWPGFAVVGTCSGAGKWLDLQRLKVSEEILDVSDRVEVSEGCEDSVEGLAVEPKVAQACGDHQIGLVTNCQVGTFVRDLLSPRVD